MAATDIVRGVSSAVSAGSVTFSTVDVTAPAGVVSGDQLALFIDTRDAYASWTPPAGWVERARPVESSGEGIFYTAKYGTDVSGTTWTFSTGEAATSAKWGWVLIALKGSAVGDYVTGAAQPQSAAGTSAPTPSISPAVPVHMVAFAGDRITGGSTWTWPSGWVEQADQQDSTGTNAISQTGAVYDTTPAAAGTYSVTPVHSTTGSIAWSGILAFAVGQADATITVPSASAVLRSADPAVTSAVSVAVPSAPVAARSDSPAPAADALVSVPSAPVVVRADPVTPVAGFDVPTAALSLFAPPPSPMSDNLIPVPTAAAALLAGLVAPSASSSLAVPSAPAFVGSDVSTVAIYYRFQRWDGVEWRRIVPLVWGPGGWAEVPVTVTD